jgi:hypothetical protein
MADTEPRCRVGPCAADATHIVTGAWLTRAWVAQPAAHSGAVPRYCLRHAEVRAARLTLAAQPKAPAARAE